jgi:uncharacterized protein (TIGR02598 family)
MDALPITGPRTLRNRRAGFSLVEVTLAVGIIAFAFVALFGLVPTGLSTFRRAMDTSVAAQIAQRVIGDAQQTDFDALIATRSPVPRYFDDQGTEITGSGRQTVVYEVRTSIRNPSDVQGTPVSALANVVVSVVNNPGGGALDIDENGIVQPTSGIAVQTYSAVVARNK